MKAIILAAGEGKRLRPATYYTPKPLLQVAGEPIVDYVINNLNCDSISGIYIAVSHLKEAVEKHFSEVKYAGVETRVVDADLWDTASDLKIAVYNADKKYNAGIVGNTFCAAFGDTITEIPMEEMISFHKEKKKLMTTAFIDLRDFSYIDDPFKEAERFGIGDIDENGIVTRFREKPKKEDIDIPLAGAGYFVIEPEILEMIDLNDKEKLGRWNISSDIMTKLADDDQLAGFKYQTSHWMDIGTKKSLKKANAKILLKEGFLPPPDKKELNNGA